MKSSLKIFVTLLIIVVILSNLLWYKEYIGPRQHNIRGSREISIALSYLLADISRYFDNLTSNTIENYGYVGVVILRILPLA